MNASQQGHSVQASTFPWRRRRAPRRLASTHGPPLVPPSGPPPSEHCCSSVPAHTGPAWNRRTVPQYLTRQARWLPAAPAGFAFVYMRHKNDGDDAIRKLDRTEYGYKRRPLRVEWASVSASGEEGPPQRLGACAQRHAPAYHRHPWVWYTRGLYTNVHMAMGTVRQRWHDMQPRRAGQLHSARLHARAWPGPGWLCLLARPD